MVSVSSNEFDCKAGCIVAVLLSSCRIYMSPRQSRLMAIGDFWKTGTSLCISSDGLASVNANANLCRKLGSAHSLTQMEGRKWGHVMV
ncbi:hypothetical protein PoB_002267600 [Plakobranchus ocellatus]|uniref:SRCR domain-containing protein n=1 Tax=Plakobranchus ocellatus TaxID=259542 RepID=A0AAV3ZA49_9GAST|nr:hypothetical protein PoB_002267600 [Plakobranchus ocellatus]